MFTTSKQNLKTLPFDLFRDEWNNLFSFCFFPREKKLLHPFTLIFSLTTGIIKKLLNMKKHDHLLILAESKFNSIETLISQALGDLDISHE